MIAYRIPRKANSLIGGVIDQIRAAVKFRGNGVKVGSFRTNGVPYVVVSRGGAMTIGKNFSMNNGVRGNPIGCYERCTFFVAPGARLTIGDNVGMSQAAIAAYSEVTIGNNVKIGGGTCVWSTDFHSLDPALRKGPHDLEHRACKPVIIGDNVFIGAKSIILKGVSIGDNSIVGAGSVVTKSIPDNEIWAGNPAVFIRKICQE